MKKLCLCLDVDCRSLIKKVNAWTQNSRIKEVIVQGKKDKIGRTILMMFFSSFKVFSASKSRKKAIQ